MACFFYIVGAYRRVLPPSCVTSAIRRKWPALEGQEYTLFKKPKSNRGTVLKWYYDSGLITEEAAVDVPENDDDDEDDDDDDDDDE
jgi:hypothetical protein